MNIGEKIYNIRKKNKISSSSLASQVGVPKHIVSSWESGYIIPDSVELKKIAQALNVSIDTLLDETEYYNSTDLLTNAYDDYKERNKGKIIFLIFCFIIIFFIIGDTLLAIALKKSPFISWRVSYLSGDSYVDKGIFINTFYCVKENNGITVSQHFKLSKYECSTSKDNNSKTNKKIKDIRDTSKDIENFKCSSAIEKIYEDEDNIYYLECTNSSYIIVTYYNEKTENIKTALEKGHITIKDLDEYGIKYVAKAIDKTDNTNPDEDNKESEYPKKDDIELTDTLTFYLHKSGNNIKALETDFIIENEKLIAINKENNTRITLFEIEPIQKIGNRSYGPTGDRSIIILTTNGNVYISQEITYSYEFGKELKFNKQPVENIVKFQSVFENEMNTMSKLIAIDKDGNEHYIKDTLF